VVFLPQGDTPTKDTGAAHWYLFKMGRFKCGENLVISRHCALLSLLWRGAKCWVRKEIAMMKFAKTIALAAAASILPLVATASTVSIAVSEEDGNVVFTGSGSVDLTGFEEPNSYSTSNRSELQNTGLGGIEVSGNPRFYFGRNRSSSDPLANIGNIAISGSSGEDFWMNPNGNLWLDLASEDSIGGTYNLTGFTWTLAGTTIETLGVNFGTVFTGDSNYGKTLTVELVEAIDVAPVPLPASILFLGAGIGGLGLMARRRRSAA